MKKELHESLEIIKKAGFLIEETDPYMNAMDDELDAIDVKNKFDELFKKTVSAVEEKMGIKLEPAEAPRFKIDYLEGNKRYAEAQIGENQFLFVVGFYNGEGRRITAFGKEIDNPWFKHMETGVGGYVRKKGRDEYVGCTMLEKDLSNLDEALDFYKKKIPHAARGFFGRMFHKEALETLSKAGFLVEASDKAKSIRDQITRAAIEKFEEIPYDEFEQEPWEDSDAIDAIPDEKFFEVMKSAINVKTQEEVLQAAEDEDKFNILADAWLEYLSDLSGYVGWEYTWNRDY